MSNERVSQIWQEWPMLNKKPFNWNKVGQNKVGNKSSIPEKY
jgi:hypothetical protein